MKIPKLLIISNIIGLACSIACIILVIINHK
jgi:hypothetical protein